MTKYHFLFVKRCRKAEDTLAVSLSFTRHCARCQAWNSSPICSLGRLGRNSSYLAPWCQLEGWVQNPLKFY